MFYKVDEISHNFTWNLNFSCVKFSFMSKQLYVKTRDGRSVWYL